MRPVPLLAALLFATAAGATAQTPAPQGKAMAAPQPACTAPAALPTDYASFAHPVPVAQGSGAFLGEAATLDLGPGTHFVTPPEHKPAGGTFGGMVGFDITDPGTYRVAVGAGVWVDVIRKDGGAARSTGHGRGPACTAVKKLVEFQLSPGHYTLQFSGSEKPSVTFQIAKAS